MTEVGDKGILFPLGNKKGSVVVMGAGTPEVGDKVIVAPLGNMKGDLVAWKPGVPEVGDKALLLPSYGMKEYVLAIKEEVDELKEGDYTTWTWKWGNTINNGIDSDSWVVFRIDDKNDVLLLAWRDSGSNDRFGIYNLADFSTVFQSSAGSNYQTWRPYIENFTGFCFGNASLWGGGFSVSFQTYVLLLKSDDKTIEVWRGGSSVLWNRNTQDDEAGAEIASGAISPTGKWIVVYDYINDKLLLYEGS